MTLLPIPKSVILSGRLCTAWFSSGAADLGWQRNSQKQSQSNPISATWCPALYRVYKYDFLIFGYSFTFGGKKFPDEENIASCVTSEDEVTKDHSIGRHIDLIARAVPPKSIDDYIWPISSWIKSKTLFTWWNLIQHWWLCMVGVKRPEIKRTYEIKITATF